METPEGFKIRALRGLSAHFNQPSGPSRPGTDWFFSVDNSADERIILVRTYTDDFDALSPEQAVQLAGDYLRHLIQTDWSPDQYGEQPGEIVVPKLFKPRPPTTLQKVESVFRKVVLAIGVCSVLALAYLIFRLLQFNGF